MRHTAQSSRCVRRRAGNAVVEFALTFGLLWMLMGGCFKIGYSIFLYQCLTSAVSGAARYAARVDFDEPYHTFATRVKNMAVYGDPAGGTARLVPGLETINVAVAWTYDAKNVPATITVSITGFSVNALFQSFTWSGKPSITVRYSGSYKS